MSDAGARVSEGVQAQVERLIAPNQILEAMRRNALCLQAVDDPETCQNREAAGWRSDLDGTQLWLMCDVNRSRQDDRTTVWARHVLRQASQQDVENDRHGQKRNTRSQRVERKRAAVTMKLTLKVI